jgi:hypothetical protein
MSWKCSTIEALFAPPFLPGIAFAANRIHRFIVFCGKWNRILHANSPGVYGQARFVRDNFALAWLSCVKSI